LKEVAPLATTALREDGPDRVACAIERAEACIEDLWPDGSRYGGSLAALRERLVEERLQVAVLGQFKRGKSTFLNALVGEDVLPTGVVPLTAIATFIHWAPAPSIRVSYLDGREPDEPPAANTAQIREQLSRFVTEEANPRNRLQVARVDFFYPAPILRHGIVLIDTPGIGSTLRHNTDAALEVLPECDAAFFVLSVDPPVTEAELAYLERVRPAVARLFFILNKIDYLGEDEGRAASEFLRRTLREHVPAEAETPIFGISARRGLQAKGLKDAEGVRRSGLAEVERHLMRFLADEKLGSLRRAVTTKAIAVLDAAGMDVMLGIRALEMPVEDLEQRAAQFTQALREIETQRLVARDLLAGDRRRALEKLEAQADALRRDAGRALLAVLEPTFDGEQAFVGLEEKAKKTLAAAIPEFFEPKLAELSRTFGANVGEILGGHVRRAETLIVRVRETAATLFEIPSIPFEAAESFIIRREPYWVTQKWSETLNPLAGSLFDNVLPAASRAARVRRRLAAEIDELVQRNVENLRWATLQNLDAAFRRFQDWFDERLAEAIEATRGAIDAALNKRREHADRARDELIRLRRGVELSTAVKEELRSEADQPKTAHEP
jgi:GTP-binding protein EngB required for normal cell division